VFVLPSTGVDTHEALCAACWPTDEPPPPVAD
jgi:hypothetical protein